MILPVVIHLFQIGHLSFHGRPARLQVNYKIKLVVIYEKCAPQLIQSAALEITSLVKHKAVSFDHVPLAVHYVNGNAVKIAVRKSLLFPNCGQASLRCKMPLASFTVASTLPWGYFWCNRTCCWGWPINKSVGFKIRGLIVTMRKSGMSINHHANR